MRIPSAEPDCTASRMSNTGLSTSYLHRPRESRRAHRSTWPDRHRADAHPTSNESADQNHNAILNIVMLLLAHPFRMNRPTGTGQSRQVVVPESLRHPIALSRHAHLSCVKQPQKAPTLCAHGQGSACTIGGPSIQTTLMCCNSANGASRILGSAGSRGTTSGGGGEGGRRSACSAVMANILIWKQWFS